MGISQSKKKVHHLSKSPRFLIGVFILFFATVGALFAPQLAPYDADFSEISLRGAPPSSQHFFGNDMHGGDVLSSLLFGSRTSLYVAFLTVFLSLTVGVLAGLAAGWFRGWVDTMIMRVIDILMAFPGILLALALASILGPSTNNIVLAIAATGWTSTARLVRGEVLSLTEREFVQAAKALGASSYRQVFIHIFPETWPQLLIQASFSLSGVILVESSLSFLGLGSQEGAPSWGTLLDQGRAALTEAPHLSIIPGIAIFLVVLAANFIGDKLRDTL